MGACGEGLGHITWRAASSAEQGVARVEMSAPDSSPRAQSAMAVTCGTPTPATMRVVQMDPGPIPTFTASAPALTRSLAALPVAMFPAITCTFGYCFLIEATRSRTPFA